MSHEHYRSQCDMTDQVVFVLKHMNKGKIFSLTLFFYIQGNFYRISTDRIRYLLTVRPRYWLKRDNKQNLETCFEAHKTSLFILLIDTWVLNRPLQYNLKFTQSTPQITVRPIAAGYKIKRSQENDIFQQGFKCIGTPKTSEI